jgi:cell division septation protein DedD
VRSSAEKLAGLLLAALLLAALPGQAEAPGLAEAQRLAAGGDWAGAARVALEVAAANAGTPAAATAFELFLRTERRLDGLLAGARAMAGKLPAAAGTPALLGEVAALFELAGFDEEAAAWAEEAWKAGGPPEMLLRSLRLRVEMGEADSVLRAMGQASAPAAGVGSGPLVAAAELAAGRIEEGRASFEDILALGTDASDRLAAAWGLFVLARAAGDSTGQERAAARLRALFPAAPESAIARPPAAGASLIVEAPSPALLLGAGQPAAASGTPSVQPQGAPPEGTYAVQVGSFRLQENADELARELVGKGYDAKARRAGADSPPLWRVYVGSTLSAADARQVLDRLTAAGYAGLLVRSP